MLRAIYSDIYGGSSEAETALSAAGIEPTIRGESLSVESFAALANHLIER
jgi:16S rRNA (adenine1518-N6/adenine1519-N6)-dimethyltransferase